MTTDDRTAFVIPRRLSSFMRRLNVEYTRAGNAQLQQLLARSRVRVEEGSEYDNWDGGTYGHNISLFLSPEDLGAIPLNSQQAVGERIRDDLRTATAAIPNEYVANVYIEMDDENDPQYQASALTLAPANLYAEEVTFWKPDHLRLFISHRDTHKHLAHQLATELLEFGISSFVAHDMIEPDSEWLREIVRALKTMEVLLALISDDFSDSAWTNQEVGFALGAGIPVLSIKLGQKDPEGFIRERQAVKSSKEKLRSHVPVIFEKLKARLGVDDRLRSLLLDNFIRSGSFEEAERRFERMIAVKGYSKADAEKISGAFSANSQLRGCWYLTRSDRLVSFLEECTGRKYTVQNGHIITPRPSDDEIPF